MSATKHTFDVHVISENLIASEAVFIYQVESREFRRLQILA